MATACSWTNPAKITGRGGGRRPISKIPRTEDLNNGSLPTRYTQ